MPESIQVGDAAHHKNGELYRIEAADDGINMVNLRNDEEFHVLESELEAMKDGNSWTFVSPNESTVEDLSDLSEDALYRYAHADEGDESRTFRVNLRWVDADDFADYGEGAVELLYRDGYVADVPVSNVETQIAAHMIERAD